MKLPYLVLQIEDDRAVEEEQNRLVDEFLDVYSLYLKTRISWIKDEVRLKAYEIHLLNPTFKFQQN